MNNQNNREDRNAGGDRDNDRPEQNYGAGNPYIGNENRGSKNIRSGNSENISMGRNMMNNNGLRSNSPMEKARQNSQRGFDRNPYIGETNNVNQNSYYSTTAQSPVQQNPSLTDSLLGSFDTENFIKGALIGAVGAYLLTNENAQKAIFKTATKGTQIFQAGMEEMKERYEDAKAEVDAE